MEYKTALETIEQWLDKKNIRLFCRTACGGKCCEPYCKTHCERPPLPCAMYLCDEMRKILFGFHNGEKYKDLRNEITGIVVYAGYPDPPQPVGIIDLEIPDRLISALLSIEFKPDIHGNG